jgi:hypothetical protein
MGAAHAILEKRENFNFFREGIFVDPKGNTLSSIYERSERSRSERSRYTDI